MKKTFYVLLISVLLFLLSVCASQDRVEVNRDEQDKITTSELREESDENKTYSNKNYGYIVQLPKNLYDNCDVVENDEKTEAYFELKDGGDMVMMIRTISDEDYEKQAGTLFLGSNNGLTTYVQLPTCGTLNNEKIRSLWEKLIEEARKMNEENISYIAF